MTQIVKYVIIKHGKKVSGIYYLDDEGKIGQPVEITQIITDGADCYPWREVYAWWPVKTVSGKYVWRQKLFKRRVWVVWGTGFHMEPETQYATAFDLITKAKEYDNLSRHG